MLLVSPDAVGAYPPTTTPSSDRSIEVTALSPVCIGDAPFIEYAITVEGFESSGPATLRFFDINGNFVEERTVPTLSGRTVYPGASVASDGTALDWPGWRWDGDQWVIDPTDQFLREGLTVEIEVNPTATATVSYPPTSAVCAGPEESTDDVTGSLPQTGGSGTMQTVSIAGAVLGAGVLITLLVRRRTTPAAA